MSNIEVRKDEAKERRGDRGPLFQHPAAGLVGIPVSFRPPNMQHPNQPPDGKEQAQGQRNSPDQLILCRKELSHGQGGEAGQSSGKRNRGKSDLTLPPADSQQTAAYELDEPAAAGFAATSPMSSTNASISFSGTVDISIL